MTNEMTDSFINRTGRLRRWKGKPSGFTLIEIMVSLVIVGILATVAGTALVAGINGYMSARENDAMAQKSQLAMARLSRELTEFIEIKSPVGSNAKADSILIERLEERPSGDDVIKSVAIGLDGQSVKIKEDEKETTPDFRDGDVALPSPITAGRTPGYRAPTTSASFRASGSPCL